MSHEDNGHVYDGPANDGPANDGPANDGPANDGAASQPAENWAICCSGGGIRSATYCLGALQSLQRSGLYGKARWIVGVSGGSYIAASLALVRHDLGPGAEGPGAEDTAYERGSAEEQHLRNNTRYIAPDAKTVLTGCCRCCSGWWSPSRW